MASGLECFLGGDLNIENQHRRTDLAHCHHPSLVPRSVPAQEEFRTILKTQEDRPPVHETDRIDPDFPGQIANAVMEQKYCSCQEFIYRRKNAMAWFAKGMELPV